MQETKRLLEIMKRLRDPNGGCPWDVEQNFSTIAPYTLEEAYEVADAIERNDMPSLKEELGDLLLQVVFHAQMAEEEGIFTFEQVAKGINDKMIDRHPHVDFSDCPRSGLLADAMSLTASPTKGQTHTVPASSTRPEIRTAQDQVDNWETIKAAEKKAKGHTSVLDDIPMNFPALLRSQKLGKKASKQGFDWPELPPVFDKVDEEMGELKEAIADNTNIEEELGDLLFAIVNVARHVKVDAETALRKANAKFEKRYRAIEPNISKDSTLEEMEALWVKAKNSG